MIHYRAIEFKETPVQPLAGDFSAAPGAAYGQLPVGPGPETALAVVWIAKADGGPVLWLDADGNGRLTPDERHAVSGKQIELAATLTMQKAPQLRQARRTLVFRRPALGTGLAYAVRGYAAGSLDFGGAKHAAILADGNADGCFNSVGHDRVWIDLNRDGRFDPLVEQFPLGKPITKDGQTYVVRSDALASSVVANHRRPGEGTLRLTLAGGQKAGTFSADLVSDLGELVAVDRLDQPIPVSHGDYRIASLRLQLAAPDGQAWNYTFDRERHGVTPLRSVHGAFINGLRTESCSAWQLRQCSSGSVRCECVASNRSLRWHVKQASDDFRAPTVSRPPVSCVAWQLEHRRWALIECRR